MGVSGPCAPAGFQAPGTIYKIIPHHGWYDRLTKEREREREREREGDGRGRGQGRGKASRRNPVVVLRISRDGQGLYAEETTQVKGTEQGTRLQSRK